MKLLSVLVILHICLAVNTSRVQNAKSQIQDEVRHAIGRPARPPSRKEITEIRHDIGHHHNLDQPRKWSHRRRLGTYFTPWTRWSECDPLCRQSRERYCRYRRKCGETKHSEERKCSRCHPKQPPAEDFSPKHQPIHSSPVKIPVYEEVPKFQDEPDYYIVKKYKKKRKPMVIEVYDYEDLEREEDEDETDAKKFNRRQVKSVRSKSWNASHFEFGPDVEMAFDSALRKGRKALPQDSSFEYEEATDSKDLNGLDNFDMEYEDYDEAKNSTRISHREKAVFELPPRHSRVYSRWSKWTKCSPKCTTRRYKRCRIREYCDEYVLREIAYCYTEGSFCQGWVESQVHKTPSYNVKPMATNRKDVVHTNAIVNDFMLSGKGYRGPEYRPLKLKNCGISAVRSNRRNSIHNMLKIIGGKTARRGQWPWQVVIFNRFKEAFCGGTLIAPNWVLTAAHCVRKVLYVRIGEHNLDIKDDSEIEMRVIKTIKHPNYDKATVDSDVALLKLPKAINPTQWIGYACMPTPFQPLPKNIQCTVIGWGKRRNRDQAGTSVLNQAEVPIISMDSCKAVYQDYTITKNMFCAGHKRGRIDTCAGDSGGPLLCRDGTQPNHPWTIFGITSFGDGCAKKNKFGIYAKVPNYVDWVWSVVNCNGNCKGRKLA